MSLDIFVRPEKAQVHRLLEEAGLPTADLTPAHLEHFLGCGSERALDGVVGLEPHGDVALLRSLAVAAGARGRGCGGALVAAAEEHAQAAGARAIYLLTTTAERFFEKRGYERISREAAPDAIRNTAEFSTLCPASSAFMVKRLPG